MKISEIKLPDVIGVAGLARSGKDTFAALSAKILSKYDKKIMKGGFAHAVKADLHQLLVSKVGISAYTEIDEEKKLIRPLLVEYGTGLMRKINKNVWVERAKPMLDLARTTKLPLFLTDVRYENEIEWIKSEGGKIVYIEQNGIKPPNAEERKNDPKMRKSADFFLNWDFVGDENILKLKPKVTKILKELSC